MAKQETTCDDILKELRAKQYRPVYYLMGEESYYIDLISDYIVDNVLTDTEKEFNLTVVYGADVDIATVINAAKRYPMMSERQVVVVKEAQAAIMPVTTGPVPYTPPTAAFGNMTRNSKNIRRKPVPWLSIWKQQPYSAAVLPIIFPREPFCWFQTNR